MFARLRTAPAPPARARDRQRLGNRQPLPSIYNATFGATEVPVAAVPSAVLLVDHPGVDVVAPV
jgi:hypothetical protein